MMRSGAIDKVNYYLFIYLLIDLLKALFMFKKQLCSKFALKAMHCYAGLFLACLSANTLNKSLLRKVSF